MAGLLDVAERHALGMAPSCENRLVRWFEVRRNTSVKAGLQSKEAFGSAILACAREQVRGQVPVLRRLAEFHARSAARRLFTVVPFFFSEAWQTALSLCGAMSLQSVQKDSYLSRE